MPASPDRDGRFGASTACTGDEDEAGFGRSCTAAATNGGPAGGGFLCARIHRSRARRCCSVNRHDSSARRGMGGSRLSRT
mmetsp:Transcript_15714/g.35023  ORF Transcript_15714/g.35023 Transcript_15714/m.35023 type:complete len:80 (+) Transcript_15714:196-435(+)